MTTKEILNYLDERTNQLSLIRRSRSLSLDDFNLKDIQVVIEYWDFIGVKALMEIFEKPLDAYLYLFDILEDVRQKEKN